MSKHPTRVKTSAIAAPVPQTLEDADAAILRLGIVQRERTLIEAAMNDELALIKDRYENQARPHREEIEALTKGIHIWCEANRDRITRDGKTKTYRFGAGEVSWRSRPPKVTIRGVDTVLDALKRLGLDRFLRVKTEVNREAMLAEPDVAKTVPGVAIGSAGEEFVVKPYESELEEVAL